MNPGELATYVIYRGPTDYPGHYVVRRWIATPDSAEPIGDPVPLIVTQSLEAARAALPGGLCRLLPSPTDPASVLEIWL